MEFAPWLNILISIVIFLLIAMIILFQYLRIIKNSIEVEWEHLLLAIRKRSDMLPLIFERLKNTQIVELKAMIKARDIALHENKCSGKKVSAEIELSNYINALSVTVEKHESLKKDMIVDAMFKDIALQEELINEQTEKYNKKVRSFNNITNIPLLSIFLKFLRFSSLQIFEFES